MMPTYGLIQEELDLLLDMVVCWIESMQTSLCKISQGPWWNFLSCNMLAWYEQRSLNCFKEFPLYTGVGGSCHSRHSVTLANAGPLIRPTLVIELIHTSLDLFVFESTYYLFFCPLHLTAIAALWVKSHVLFAAWCALQHLVLVYCIIMTFFILNFKIREFTW
jgi:hypothetical protein